MRLEVPGIGIVNGASAFSACREVESQLSGGATAIFVIERKLAHAAAFAVAGALLTFFGCMHGESVGLAVTPSVALAYGAMAVLLFGWDRYPQFAAASAPMPKEMAAPAE